MTPDRQGEADLAAGRTHPWADLLGEAPEAIETILDYYFPA